jgi:hypothetical protein
VAAGGGSNDGSELARVQQLLLKRTAELDEREEALIKADRWAWGDAGRVGLVSTSEPSDTSSG